MPQTRFWTLKTKWQYGQYFVVYNWTFECWYMFHSNTFWCYQLSIVSCHLFCECWLAFGEDYPGQGVSWRWQNMPEGWGSLGDVDTQIMLCQQMPNISTAHFLHKIYIVRWGGDTDNLLHQENKKYITIFHLSNHLHFHTKLIIWRALGFLENKNDFGAQK